MKRSAVGVGFGVILVALVAAADNGRARINPNAGFLIGRSGGGRAGRLTSGSCTPATGGPVTNSGWRVQETSGFSLVIAEGTGVSPGCKADESTLNLEATSAGQVAVISDDGSSPAHICPNTTSNVSLGVWVDATTSGTTDLCTDDPLHAWLCYPLTFTAGQHLYKFEDKPYWIGTSSVAIGNASFINGGTTRSSATIKVWGARCNAGATLSP